MSIALEVATDCSGFGADCSAATGENPLLIVPPTGNGTTVVSGGAERRSDVFQQKKPLAASNSCSSFTSPPPPLLHHLRRSIASAIANSALGVTTDGGSGVGGCCAAKGAAACDGALLSSESSSASFASSSSALLLLQRCRAREAMLSDQLLFAYEALRRRILLPTAAESESESSTRAAAGSGDAAEEGEGEGMIDGAVGGDCRGSRLENNTCPPSRAIINAVPLYEPMRVVMFGSIVANGSWDGVGDMDLAVVDASTGDIPVRRRPACGDGSGAEAAPPPQPSTNPLVSEELELIQYLRELLLRPPPPPPQQQQRSSSPSPSPSSLFALKQHFVEDELVIVPGARVPIVKYTSTGSSDHHHSGGTRTIDSSSGGGAAGGQAVSGTAPHTDSTDSTAAPSAATTLTAATMIDIDFDITARLLGARNSWLLRRYMEQSPVVRSGALYLKQWSKRSGVNSSANGLLSSYGVTILWVFFLLQRGYVDFVDPESIRIETVPDTPHPFLSLLPSIGEGKGEEEGAEKEKERDRAVAPCDNEGHGGAAAAAAAPSEMKRSKGEEEATSLVRGDVSSSVDQQLDDFFSKVALVVYEFFCFYTDAEERKVPSEGSAAAVDSSSAAPISSSGGGAAVPSSSLPSSTSCAPTTVFGEVFSLATHVVSINQKQLITKEGLMQRDANALLLLAAGAAVIGGARAGGSAGADDDAEAGGTTAANDAQPAAGVVGLTSPTSSNATASSSVPATPPPPTSSSNDAALQQQQRQSSSSPPPPPPLPTNWAKIPLAIEDPYEDPPRNLGGGKKNNRAIAAYILDQLFVARALLEGKGRGAKEEEEGKGRDCDEEGEVAASLGRVGGGCNALEALRRARRGGGGVAAAVAEASTTATAAGAAVPTGTAAEGGGGVVEEDAPPASSTATTADNAADTAAAEEASDADSGGNMDSVAAVDFDFLAACQYTFDVAHYPGLETTSNSRKNKKKNGGKNGGLILGPDGLPISEEDLPLCTRIFCMSTKCVGKRHRDCDRGPFCHLAICRMKHPSDWDAARNCQAGVKCPDTECQFRHCPEWDPLSNQIECPKGLSCGSHWCPTKRRHPEGHDFRVNIDCKFGVYCEDHDCMYRHNIDVAAIPMPRRSNSGDGGGGRHRNRYPPRYDQVGGGHQMMKSSSGGTDADGADGTEVGATVCNVIDGSVVESEGEAVAPEPPLLSPEGGESSAACRGGGGQ